MFGKKKKKRQHYSCQMIVNKKTGESYIQWADIPSELLETGDTVTLIVTCVDRDILSFIRR